MGSPGWRLRPCSQSWRASSGLPELNAAVARRTRSSAECWVMPSTLLQIVIAGRDALHRPRNDNVEGGCFLLRRRRLQRRIVRVALGAAAIEGRLVRRVERRAALEALDQIRIGKERFSERDQVGFISRQ